jgi:hypothetical protein
LTNQQTGTTFTPNYATSPTGANDANRLTWSAGTANQNWGKALDANGVHTVSGYFKYVSGGTVIDFTLFAYQSGNSGFRGVRLTYVNATTLTLSNAIPSIPVDSYGSEYVGNGWHRVWFTTTLANSVGNGYSEYNINRENVPDVSSASEWLWFGGQMEAGSIATSYIDVGPQPFNVVIAWPNGGVTRSADVASSVAYTRASDKSRILDCYSKFLDYDQGTFYIEGSTSDITASSFLQISDGTTANRIILQPNNNGHTALVSSSSSQASLDLGTTTVNAFSKIAFAYADNDFAGSKDGGSVVTDSSGSVGLYPQLHIGGNYDGSGAELNGHLKKLVYYPERLSNAELQALTENN